MNAESIRDVLFQPLKINGVTARNRLAMGPIAAHGPHPDGRASDQTAAFFEARARGGIGLIIVGGAISTTHGWEGHIPNPDLLRLDRDDFVPDLQRVTEAVHRHDTPIFAQINTGQGRMGVPGPNHIAASAKAVDAAEEAVPNGVVIPGGLHLPPPREASADEIHMLESDTAASAIRMKRAGFDGVELGAHMSYFLSSFLSPRTNWREDEYGGGTQNRARIVCNIIRQIRAEAGPDFPIGVRMCVNEQVEGGQGPAGYAEIAAEFEKAGADYIAMTNGGYEKMNLSLPMRDGALVENGEPAIMRKAVSIPLLMQSVHDPANAATYISAGHADMVMLARQMLADPDYANKVRDGRLNDITWCNRENVCLRRLMMDMPVKCPLNPRSGIESQAPGAAPSAGQWLQNAKEAFLLTVTKSRTVTKIGMRLKGH